MCLVPLCGMGQTADDPVLMEINGKGITRSEFEYSYNKNNDGQNEVEYKSVDEYVDMFINYKLKVEEALAARIDTTQAFRKEFESYRDMQLTPLLIDTMYIDSVARDLYSRLEERMEGKDLIHPAQILISVPQNAGESERRQRRLLADSIYNLLQQGEDFSKLAQKYSDDTQTAANGGQLPWMGPHSMSKDFEDKAYSMNVGDLSKPFESVMGFHILRMNDRRPLEAYEQLKPILVKALERRDIEDESAKSTIRKIAAASNGRLTREMVVDSVLNVAIAQDPDLKFLVQEYHDGLLLYEISKQKIWDESVKDTSKLEEYFEANRNKYKWDEPRFKGFVFYATDKKYLKPVKKILKKIKDDSWYKTIKDKYNNDSTINVYVCSPAFYKKGDNAYVDELVFGGPAAKCPDAFTCVGVAGDKLKQPRELKDAMSSVISDYQEELERQWVDELRKKYSFKVNQDILKTVNNHND